MKLEKFEQIVSTNDYMKEKKEVEEWDTVYALTQTKGRGRNGKKWVSDEGGAWFTTVIKEQLEIPMSQYVKLPLVIGAALLNVLENLELKNVKIKWPNDIYVNDKKICGILVEKSGENFIAGIGINVNMEKMDKEVENIATSILIENGKKYEIEEIILKSIETIKKYYEIFIRGGWNGIVEIIRKNDYLKGKTVELILENRTDTGVAAGITRDGEIEVKIAGELKIYCSGEVSIKKYNGRV